MKSPYISELQQNQQTTGVFLVLAKEVRQKKNGDLYLSLQLGDRTGEADAKMWDNAAEVAETFGCDDFVRVKGVLNLYQNRPQFTIHKLQRVEEAEIDVEDFFPRSARDLDEMYAELLGVVATVGNPALKALLEAVFGDPEVARLYRRAPAAKTVHHAYVGGLLEHTLSLVKLCRLAAPNYAEVDLDLLTAGALLHDLGKIHELSFDRGFGYTSEGQLLGHITIGIRMLEEKMRQIPEFPPRLRTLVEHMVLSHHGQMEFGSPKVPLFAEAVLLHFLDDLDSKMECVRAAVVQDRQMNSEWTGYNQPMGRSILKKDLYLNGPVPPPGEAPAAGRPDSAPAAAKPAPKPKSATPFGEKLLGALSGPSGQEIVK